MVGQGGIPGTRWESEHGDDEDNGEPAEALTAIGVVPGGRREIIELALVTSLRLAPAAQEGEGKSKGK